MKLFGRSKKQEQPTDPQEALNTITKLRTTLEDLDKRQKVLEAKARNELETAKEKNRQKDRRGALYSLKKKKMYEAEVAKLDAAKMNLDQQIFMIEGAWSNVSIFKAMQEAQTTLTNQHRNITVEQVDQLRDQIEEHQQLQDEISDALTQPIGNLANMDDDELLDELNQLEATEMEEKMLDLELPTAAKAKPVVVAPAARAPAVAKKDDLEDLMNQMLLSR
jgi:charged multivesicular body protein 4